MATPSWTDVSQDEAWWNTFKAKTFHWFSNQLWTQIYTQESLKLEVDAGTATNVVTLGTFQKIFPGQAPSPWGTYFCVYGDSTIECNGRFCVFIIHLNKRFRYLFLITSERGPILLSYGTSCIMYIVKPFFAIYRNSGILKENSKTAWKSMKNVTD